MPTDTDQTQQDDQDTATDQVDQDTTTEDTTDDATELGDAGRQALDRMKARERATRAELREFKALGLTPDQIKALQDAGKSKDDVDPDRIRDEARREARTEAQRERVVDKIEARAARRFADAEDAVAILLRSHDADDFLDGDKIDVEAIQEALNDLLEKKPHLAAAQSDGRRFKGSGDGGTRKESRPGQLTRDDLKRMSPQDIEKARRDGRLNDILGIK